MPNLDDKTVTSLVLVGMLLLLCWLIFYKPSLLKLEKFKGGSFHDWPLQPLGTASRQARLTRGYNQPINPALPDPYMAGILDMSAQENSWTTADWSADE